MEAEETKFFMEKLELDYGNKKAVKKLKEISKKIYWLKGWPEDKMAFWNGEAFMWGCKIDKDKRKLIGEELKFLEKGKNLDLGCGSHSYVKSVGFDLAEKMLLLNNNLSEGVTGDLEGKLPFEEENFDSATLVFVLNYVENYHGLLEETFRVLKKGGSLVIVQPVHKVEKWYKRKVANKLNYGEWIEILEEKGFKVEPYKKEGLWFFRCVK